MRTHEDPARRDEDGLAVVADESDDGSFELRVTRTAPNPRTATPPGSAVAPTAHTPTAASTPVDGTRDASASGGRSMGAVAVAVLALVGLGIAAVVATRGPAPNDDASAGVVTPVEADDDAGFRVFYLDSPVQQPVRTLQLDLDAGIDLGAPERQAEADSGLPAPRVAGPQARPEDLPAIGDSATQDDEGGQVLEAREAVEVRHLDELTIERLRQVQVEVPVDPDQLVLPQDEWTDDDVDPELDDE